MAAIVTFAQIQAERQAAKAAPSGKGTKAAEKAAEKAKSVAKKLEDKAPASSPNPLTRLRKSDEQIKMEFKEAVSSQQQIHSGEGILTGHEISLIRFSQSSISPTTTEGIPLDNLKASIKKEWVGAIDVVVLASKVQVSIDNRRLFCCKQLLEEKPDLKIQVVYRQFDDPCSRVAEARRTVLLKIKEGLPKQSDKLQTDEYKTPDERAQEIYDKSLIRLKIKKDTWGEMLFVRSNGTRANGYEQLPTVRA